MLSSCSLKKNEEFKGDISSMHMIKIATEIISMELLDSHYSVLFCSPSTQESMWHCFLIQLSEQKQKAPVLIINFADSNYKFVDYVRPEDR
ncbi:hypothetical protein GCM10011365_19460 [Marinicella pacifica]|uniref:Uncharacterized protein n=1 Tax=Marinicella pacifica TaxID=1171543 RepID=A0A917CVD9_9GAMM|nr:hypothetical protein GCM10011365_19460 [Marinicella pacifica]